MAQLKEFQASYKADHVVVWIDTDLKTANQRLRERDGAASRTRIEASTQTEDQIELGQNNADVVFEPDGDLATDKATFINHIRQTLA